MPRQHAGHEAVARCSEDGPAVFYEACPGSQTDSFAEGGLVGGVLGDYCCDSDEVTLGVCARTAGNDGTAASDCTGASSVAVPATCAQAALVTSRSVGAYRTSPQAEDKSEVPRPPPSLLLTLGGMPHKDTVAVAFERFQEGDLAPQRPRDPLFRLRVTSLSVAASAAAVGNALIDLLEAGAGSVGKVDRSKCSIRAEAAVQGQLTCVLKLRFYAEPSGSLAVEFRRWGGDGVAFNSVFQQARAELERLGPVALL